ncbi:hypothetical protein QOZ96_001111 [Brevundimonas nasdae]|jgi:hypothetical protein|uniref:hypothetical protein n=1 Tax=Brevundimonas nasdae TaxID=172043 RepID=UPI0019115936|nr:hypothetical protein [Brevundimonas nasdae]MBK6024867.1 hypothetical protein [Brevundimonas nasdae]MDQ0451168.1 hypothetical protein [Brevundimonas nasdae]
MKRFLTFPRLAMLFAGVFGLAVIGVFAIQNYWVAPGKRCEAAGKWYDMENRICAQPISIAEITGRPIGVSRAEASAEKNRELVKIENEIALQNQARDAEIARQKAALAARKGN